MSKLDSLLWITWETQRRNRSLSSRIGAPLHEIIRDGPRALRYLRSIYQTLRLVLSIRPKTLFVQNPSVALALLAVIIRRARLIEQVVVDAHNAGIFPEPRSSVFLKFISRIICRLSDYTIVTNPGLANVVHERGGRALVLPDPLPTFADLPRPAFLRPAKYNVLFVCTWASDEPWKEVLLAAASLGEPFSIYVTGRFEKISAALPSEVPKNVRLTGFLSQIEFDALLQHCDIVVDLTTREDCLVCGAYEAIAAERLLLLSQTYALQSYFGACAIYCDNTASGIESALRLARESHITLEESAKFARLRLREQWDRIFDSFRSTICR